MHTIKKSQIKGKGSKERELKMNKLLRKVMVLALAGTMTVGMNATVFAENTQTPTTKETNSQLTKGGNNVTSDTTTINLIKDYILGDGSDQDSSSPAEDFVFTITPYGVWNAGSTTGKADGAAYNVNNMPALAQVKQDVTSVTVDETGKINTVTIPVIDGNAGTSTKSSTSITLNKFNSVGDFWYEVEETNNHTTGVFYGTNDSATTNVQEENGGHTATYYIHVQVVNNPSYDATSTSSKEFYRSVTMHKIPPTVADTDVKYIKNNQYNEWAAKNYADAVKVNDIQNTYYAGDLSIKKVVTGNSGDKNKRFKITVTFTKPVDTIITSDITYEAVNSENSETRDNNTILNQTANNSKWTENGGSSIISTTSTNVATNQVDFWIKDGETVTFKNIPYGVSYKITEKRPENDAYTHSFEHDAGTKESEGKFNNVKTDADGVTPENSATGTDETNLDANWNAACATGSITDASDTVTITNTKVSTIDVGVITSNAPYVAMLLLVAAAAFVFVHRRKNMIEE